MSAHAERVAMAALVQTAMTSPQTVVSVCADLSLSAQDFAQPAAAELFESILKSAQAGRLFVASLAPGLSPGAIKAATWAEGQPHATRLLEAVGALKNERYFTAHLALSHDYQTALKAKDLPAMLAIAKIMAEGPTSSAWESRTLQAVGESVLSQIRSGRAKLIQSGLSAFDSGTGGIPANLCIIGAQPGVGKSGFLASLALAFAGSGKRVGILSLEDEGEWVLRRMFARGASMAISDVLTAGNKPYVMERLERTAKDLADNFGESIRIVDMQRPKAAHLVAACEAMVARHGVDVLFVDHIGEIQADTERQRHDLEVDGVLSDVRNLARRKGIPILVLAHTRRGEDGASPRLTDFAFSSGMERKARLALILTRKEGSSEMTVHVLKNTEGPSGQQFSMRFDKQSGMVI